MEEEEKVETEKIEKNIGCCSGNHGIGVVLIALVLLFIAGGVVGVAKMVFFHNNFGRSVIQRDAAGGCSLGASRYGRMIQGQGERVGATQGIVGKITKIDGDNITIHKDSNGKDYVVVIAETTQIRKDGEIASKTDLAVGQAITVQGSANSSAQIAASTIIIN